MRHCDDEKLAALALGEPMDAADAAHVEGCARCSAEVEHLRVLEDRLVGAGASGPLTPAPDRVWDAIQAELAQPEAQRAHASTPPPPARDARVRDEGLQDSHATASSGGGAPPLDDLASRRERRRRPWVVGAAAAAAGVVIGGVGVTLVNQESTPAQTLVAQAQLADLATEADAGTARVERREDGTEVLVIDTPAPTDADGALEVWLIDPDVVGMVSVGFLTGDHGEFEIPDGYDVEAFPIVDISVEPADGDPTHSGDSITRGVLGA